MAHPGGSGFFQNQGYIDCSHSQNSHNSYVTDNHVNNSMNNSVHNSTETHYGNVNNSTITTHNTFGTPTGEEQKLKELLDWLSSLNFRAKHNETINMREPDTGQWFLEHPAVLKWLNGGDKTLFCHGIPGAGKSTLIAIIIEYLKERFKNDKTVAITYIYCNYKERFEHTAPNLISNLLRQLAVAAANTSNNALHDLRKSYEDHKKHSTIPSQIECVKLLNALLPAFTTVFIIVDALDEMLDTERDRLVPNLKDLAKVKGVSLLVSSRPIAHIEEKFRGTARMEIIARENDVVAYIKGQISIRHGLATLVRKNATIGEEITKGIINKARGMFLLARFHLDAVATARTAKELFKLLQDLPDEIGATYRDALTRIETTGFADLAREVLIWITYTLRPLTIKELQHALAMKDLEINAPPDEESLIFEDKILAACAGLVIYDEASGLIRLVHYTAEEYFRKYGLQILHPMPDERIAMSCMKYLSLGPRVYRLFSLNEMQYRFLLYVAEYWGHHARRVYERGKLEPLHQQILTFLMQQEEFFEFRVVKCFWERWMKWEVRELDAPPPLVASRFGLYDILKTLLKQGTYSALCGWWQNALGHAVRGEHQNVLQLLVVNKAVNVRLSGKKALIEAARGGYEDIMRLLWKNGADMDIKYYGEISLHAAVEGGHEGIVQLLLEKGAPVDAEFMGRTSLCAAAKGGHEGIVRLLLEKGADIETMYNGKAPLYAAAKGGHKGIVRLLLEKGARVDAGGFRTTSLCAAAKGGHEGIARLLLEKGARVDAGYFGATSLCAAAKGGHEGIVRLLLEKGAPVDAEFMGRTSLYAAIEGGHEGIVRLLLEKGTKIGTEGQVAMLSKVGLIGNEDIMVELLQKGVDMTLDGGVGLCLAAKYGSVRLGRVLLEQFGDLNANGAKALSIAAHYGHERIVRLLLQRGVDVNTIVVMKIYMYQNGKTLHLGDYWSPLSLAILGGYPDIVELLLEHGADANVALGVEAERALLVDEEKPDPTRVIMNQLLLEKGRKVPSSAPHDTRPAKKRRRLDIADLVN